MTPSLLDEILQSRAAGKAFCLAASRTRGTFAIVEPCVDTSEDWAPGILAAADAALKTDKVQTVAHGGQDVMLLPQNPKAHLVCIGAVHISQALLPIMRAAGFRVTLIDPRSAFLNSARFETIPGEITTDERWPDEAMAELSIGARTAIVTLTHDPKLDDPALVAALNSDAFYIGALGSKRTHAKRVERLGEAGFTGAQIDKIAAPIGLDIGAQSPAEIAVSIASQVIARLRGRAEL